MKIVFMGTPQAAVPSLEGLIKAGHEVVAVYTQPDRPSGRGNKVSFSPVKQYAHERGIDVLQPTKVRTEETAEAFRSHKADVAIVVAYGRILPDAFLTAFPHGAINVHFSMLPKYRGAAPVNWAIVNRESETGVTTMKMDSGLDTGDILLQRATPIGPQEDAVELMARLSIVGADLLDETLDGLNTIIPSPQDDTLATLAPLMRKEDGRIDWTLDADAIAARIRGFQPFPTAFTAFRGGRFTIWQAAATELEVASLSFEAGTIVSARGDELVVACGTGTYLRIAEAQAEGKRRMAVRDIINGLHPMAGEKLGL